MHPLEAEADDAAGEHRREHRQADRGRAFGPRLATEVQPSVAAKTLVAT